jgi:hypothetical protein
MYSASGHKAEAYMMTIPVHLVSAYILLRRDATYYVLVECIVLFAAAAVRLSLCGRAIWPSCYTAATTLVRLCHNTQQLCRLSYCYCSRALLLHYL